MMLEFRNFNNVKNEIKQDEIYYGLPTIIIDIENTLIVPFEIKSLYELN